MSSLLHKRKPPYWRPSGDGSAADALLWLLNRYGLWWRFSNAVTTAFFFKLCPWKVNFNCVLTVCIKIVVMWNCHLQNLLTVPISYFNFWSFYQLKFSLKVLSSWHVCLSRSCLLMPLAQLGLLSTAANIQKNSSTLRHLLVSRPAKMTKKTMQFAMRPTTVMIAYTTPRARFIGRLTAWSYSMSLPSYRSMLSRGREYVKDWSSSIPRSSSSATPSKTTTSPSVPTTASRSDRSRNESSSSVPAPDPDPLASRTRPKQTRNLRIAQLF